MATRAEPILRLVGLAKHFGVLKAVDDITLDIHDGEFFTVVGPSGSGKTTLLRMLTGMEHPTAGDILLRGERVPARSTRLWSMGRSTRRTLGPPDRP